MFCLTAPSAVGALQYDQHFDLAVGEAMASDALRQTCKVLLLHVNVRTSSKRACARAAVSARNDLVGACCQAMQVLQVENGCHLSDLTFEESIIQHTLGFCVQYEVRCCRKMC